MEGLLFVQVHVVSKLVMLAFDEIKIYPTRIVFF